MFGNRRHFRVLQEQSEEGIAFNILADRLRGLVEEGLLTREGAGRGRRSTYSLTEAAIELVAVMAELGRWGALIWRRMNRRRIDGRRAVSAAPQEEPAPARPEGRPVTGTCTGEHPDQRRRRVSSRRWPYGWICAGRCRSRSRRWSGRRSVSGQTAGCAAGRGGRVRSRTCHPRCRSVLRR
ncbi:transcriptional regulator [Rhodococcus sp. WS4]|nr:transcriptional regulator [Rhodococcus sp. WS4]